MTTLAVRLPSHLVVKICGICTVKAALGAAAAGADLLGFNFAPVSRRRTDPALASDAMAAVRSIGNRGQGPAAAGIFVNQPLEEVARIARQAALDYIQLSGEEDLAYCAGVGTATGLPIVKAVRVARPEDESRACAYAENVALLLADAAVAGSWGGAGQAWDWAAVAGLAGRYPLLLAGGLNPENVGRAIAAVRPRGVDVASGVETNGRTDPSRVEAFIQQVRNHERSHLAATESAAIAG